MLDQPGFDTGVLASAAFRGWREVIDSCEVPGGGMGVGTLGEVVALSDRVAEGVELVVLL